ncbi:hypothetical protein B0H14DRAFT_2644879 [Mycena olivaceomarginata]|nr:hypothetical protein B0H14DRAFT_2644879 [Mycena olivaceomarginata]
MAVNHTSESQFEGWEELIGNLYKLFKTSWRSETADDARHVWLKKKAISSGGAIQDSARARERRGEQAIYRMLPIELAEMIFMVSQDAVVDDCWGHPGIRTTHGSRTLLGQAELNKLIDEERQNVDLFIRMFGITAVCIDPPRVCHARKSLSWIRLAIRASSTHCQERSPEENRLRESGVGPARTWPEGLRKQRRENLGTMARIALPDLLKIAYEISTPGQIMPAQRSLRIARSSQKRRALVDQVVRVRQVAHDG